MKQIRNRLTYANLMSTIAVFLVLGGGAAFAATKLAKNSVGTNQIKKEAVTAGKLKNAAVIQAKIGGGAVGAQQLAKAAVTNEKLAGNAVNSGNLANNSVSSGKIAKNAVTSEKLAANSVTAEKIAAGSVTTAKLGSKAVGLGQLDLVVVGNQVNVSAGENKSVTAVCPAGTSVISGGGGFPGVPGNEVSFVASEAAGGGWYTEGRSIAGVHTLLVQAWCLRTP